MTSSIFEEWLTRFNAKMRAQDRRVILLLDNAPSHPTHFQLSNVKLTFLPPNTTSVLQPLDQGIIQNIKMLYRRKLLEHVLRQCDAYSSGSYSDIARCIDVHRAVDWLNQAMNGVKAETVQKCFKRCGAYPEGASAPVVEEGSSHEWDQEDDIPLSQLCSRVAALTSLQEPLTAREYCQVDSDCPAHDYSETHGVGDEEDEQEEEETQKEEGTTAVRTTDT